MGFFSWKCKKCSHSIKSPYDIPAGWDYMNECVLLRDGWDPVIGKYDGYGNITGEQGSLNCGTKGAGRARTNQRLAVSRSMQTIRDTFMMIRVMNN